MIRTIDFINECIDDVDSFSIELVDEKSKKTFFSSPIVFKEEFLTLDKFLGVRNFITQHTTPLKNITPYSSVADLPPHLNIEVWACENDYYFGGYVNL